MRALLVLLFLVLAGSAQAGAWPRGEGKAFVASGIDQSRAQMFSEWGLRGDWTLGVESSLPFGRSLPDVTISVFHPIWRSGGAILSAGGAVERRGAFTVDGRGFALWEPETVLRAGLFFGYGFKTRFGNGWATAEAQVERSLRKTGFNHPVAAKLDMTLGLRPMDRLLVMAQLQAMQHVGGQLYLRMETTTGLKFGNKTFTIAPSYPLVGPGKMRIKLGLWIEF